MSIIVGCPVEEYLRYCRVMSRSNNKEVVTVRNDNGVFLPQSNKIQVD